MMSKRRYRNYKKCVKNESVPVSQIYQEEQTVTAHISIVRFAFKQNGKFVQMLIERVERSSFETTQS